jgi:hypothetical protein
VIRAIPPDTRSPLAPAATAEIDARPSSHPQGAALATAGRFELTQALAGDCVGRRRLDCSASPRKAAAKVDLTAPRRR